MIKKPLIRPLFLGVVDLTSHHSCLSWIVFPPLIVGNSWREWPCSYSRLMAWCLNHRAFSPWGRRSTEGNPQTQLTSTKVGLFVINGVMGPPITGWLGLFHPYNEVIALIKTWFLGPLRRLSFRCLGDDASRASAGRMVHGIRVALERRNEWDE